MRLSRRRHRRNRGRRFLLLRRFKFTGCSGGVGRNFTIARPSPLSSDPSLLLYVDDILFCHSCCFSRRVENGHSSCQILDKGARRIPRLPIYVPQSCVEKNFKGCSHLKSSFVLFLRNACRRFFPVDPQLSTLNAL